MNSPEQKLSPLAQKLLQLEPGYEWRPDFLEELDDELYLAELDARQARAVDRASWLVDVARRLTGTELAFILCELYEPSQLASVLGRMATDLRFVEVMNELRLCGVYAHHERDACDRLVIEAHFQARGTLDQIEGETP